MSDARKNAALSALLRSQEALPVRSRLEAPTLFSYVDAVARHGSIRKAAEALHIASSALNRRILDLEEQVGSPLFERLPRGVRATAAGELFLTFVRKSLKDLQVLEAQLDGLRGLSRGGVRVAVAESVTGGMLPDAIASYRAQHPGVSFSVTVDGPQRLHELLLRDAVDLILTHEDVHHADMSILARARNPLCVLVSPGHPLASQASVRLSDCVGYAIAMPDESLAARKVLDRALERGSARFEPALVSNSIEMTKIFARTHSGLCFSFQVESASETSGMVSIPLSDPELRDCSLYLVSRRGRVLPVAAAAFAEQLSECLPSG